MREHQSNVKRMVESSKLVEHIEEYKPHFDFSKVETLAWESDWNPGNQNIIKNDVFYAKNTKKMAFRMMERTKTLMYFDFINEKGTFHQYHSMILIFY